MVLDKLNDAGLKLRLSKCCFAKEEVRYLSHIISRSGIKPDPAKKQVVSEFPPPHNA